MVELVGVCAWCESKEAKQPPLPGFGITHRICPKHEFLMYLKIGKLNTYLEKRGLEHIQVV